MSAGEMSYTTAGNLRPPPRLLICQWVVKSWLSLSRDLIVKSFKTCAISNAIDGSEDHEILCLRDGEHSAIVREDVRILAQELIANNGNYSALDLDTRRLLIEEDANDAANDSPSTGIEDDDSDDSDGSGVDVPGRVQVPVPVPIPAPVPVANDSDADSDASVGSVAL